MDLGCIDMGCISVSDKKLNSESTLSTESKETDSGSESVTATSKIGKNKQMKENVPTSLNSVNRSASQIKKPSHRRNSPINWFPRKKVDSYLKRKIQMLQEVAGMNSTLDETLGDTNPHYSKVLKEKMAAREAANKAIEARKAALVEASWCRILNAARIQRKEAEAELVKAEEAAAEAFEAALAIGVNMYDIPNCPQKPHRDETKISSYSHGVTASFETAFEVDKEVASSVKSALVRLVNGSSFERDEFRDLLRKISQNPDEQQQSDDGDSSSETSNQRGLVDMMFDRLERLREDEISSLATIVATCGLNAALAESCADHHALRKKQAELEVVPGLDKVLVKHVTRLEREVQEAKKNFGGESREAAKSRVKEEASSSELPSLDKFLVKRMTRLEKEVQEAKERRQNRVDYGKENEGAFAKKKPGIATECESLDKVLIKHVSKLEREKLAAAAGSEELKKCKENARLKTAAVGESGGGGGGGLDEILVKPKSRLEREKMMVAVEDSSSSSSVSVSSRREARERELREAWGGLDLGNSMKPHISKLQRDKAAWIKAEDEERKQDMVF